MEIEDLLQNKVYVSYTTEYINVWYTEQIVSLVSKITIPAQW